MEIAPKGIRINLVSSREDVFMVVKQIGVFKWPDPLRGDRSKRNQTKYCQYHKDVGHTIEECITLKETHSPRVPLGLH